jgi:hypothetical protein
MENVVAKGVTAGSKAQGVAQVAALVDMKHMENLVAAPSATMLELRHIIAVERMYPKNKGEKRRLAYRISDTGDYPGHVILPTEVVSTFVVYGYYHKRCTFTTQNGS